MQRTHATPRHATPQAADGGGSAAAAIPGPATLTFSGTHAEQREQVHAAMRSTREWLESHEASSPASILLKQAEKFLGRRYAEVAHAIPQDLLAKWDLDDH